MSTNIQLLSAIRPSDIPAEYADLVEVLGLDGFLTLVDLCGGQSLYIPKGETLRRDGRNREIRARFNGGNYRALASQFRLSERQIRKIVNELGSIIYRYDDLMRKEAERRFASGGKHRREAAGVGVIGKG